MTKSRKPRTPSQKKCLAIGCGATFSGANGQKYCEPCRPVQHALKERAKAEKKANDLPEVKTARYLRYKPGMLARAVERYNTEPEFREKQSRKNIRRKEKTHGAEEGTYERLLLEQNGLCANCGRLQKTPGKRLNIDHCHATDTIRGLLCDSCNKGLGHFHDSVWLLVDAARYVNRDPAVEHALRDVIHYLMLASLNAIAPRS